MMQPYALITGASKGIGKAIAECCAAQGIHLALVSLQDEHLETTAGKISNHFHVDVKFLEIDLSLPGSPKKLLNWCLNEKIEVNILINNAGIGYQGNFEDFDSEYYRQLLNINVIAPVLITREFLPMLKIQKEAWVLFSSSFAGFYPMPFKVAYAASKSFVTQFSKGLFQELKSLNINVSVLCPAGVDSYPESSERIDQIGWISKSGRLSPRQVAMAAVKGMFKRKRKIIPGKINILFYFVLKLLPQNFVVKTMHHVLGRLHPSSKGQVQYGIKRSENRIEQPQSSLDE